MEKLGVLRDGPIESMDAGFQERADGFYWVKHPRSEAWTIAEKQGQTWVLFDWEGGVPESSFSEIGERIERAAGDTYEQAVMRSAEHEMATMIPEICKRARQ